MRLERWMDGYLYLVFGAIILESLGADGNSRRPFPTKTGQRSGELTANSG